MPIHPNRDIELLSRFRAGDVEAFTLLYRANQATVFRFAMLMTGDAVRAAEVTQDVFVWLIHQAGNFDPSRGDLKAFLTGVTRKFLQRRRRDERRWVQLDDSSLAVQGSGESENGDLREAGKDAAALRQAILTLPENYREAVVCCDLEEMSYDEAASLIGCAVGTIRSRLHRARALLARKLEKHSERKAEKCPM